MRIVLCACYAVSGIMLCPGTDLRRTLLYRPTRMLRGARSAICLRACYAMSGSDLIWLHAMSGTDLARRCTRLAALLSTKVRIFYANATPCPVP
eukprot:796232-Rhodomonas_salina.1